MDADELRVLASLIDTLNEWQGDNLIRDITQVHVKVSGHNFIIVPYESDHGFYATETD